MHQRHHLLALPLKPSFSVLQKVTPLLVTPSPPFSICEWMMVSLLKTFTLLYLFFLPFTTLSQPLFSQSPTPSPSLNTSHTYKHQHHHNHVIQVLLGLLLGSLTGFVSSLVFLFLIRQCLFYINQAPVLKGPVVFSPAINPKSLHCSLAGSSQGTNLIGSGPHGKYLRATLDDGLVVAIKLLEPNYPNGSIVPLQGKAVKRRVQGDLEVLAMVKHRNVMSLKAYVFEHERLSLVYDYVGNGSLEDAMKRVRSNQVKLGWDVRHKIAVGIVRGLKYLHFECSPRILHYGLKPSNVLLDEEFEPRLGDCGLLRLLGAVHIGRGESASSYSAPECLQSCRYTDKSDVYSFGVILGMLLTGRDPLDPFFSGDSCSLGRWLRNLQQRGEAHEALDKEILGEECEEDEMMMAVRIAVVCLSDLPADRPSSDELVVMLTQLHSF